MVQNASHLRKSTLIFFWCKKTHAARYKNGWFYDAFAYTLVSIYLLKLSFSILTDLLGWSTWKTVNVPPPLVSTTKARNLGFTAQKLLSWALFVKRIFSKHWPWKKVYRLIVKNHYFVLRMNKLYLSKTKSW